MSRNFLQGFSHVSPASPVRGDWGYMRTGSGSAPPFRDQLVTGSHLFMSPVCHMIGLWEPRILLGLRPWTFVGDLRNILCSVVAMHHAVRDGLA